MSTYIIKNARVTDSGNSFFTDLFIKNQRIEKIDKQITSKENHTEIIADGLELIPGVIDDQVHFREPGLTHKADIYTESRAAVAGGITSFMEMPNTNPQTSTQETLIEKFDIASRNSLANYSFYFGATNDNLEELLKTNQNEVCGIKIFMGSSTGNMLVDDDKVLEDIFSNSPMLKAVHCEDEETIKKSNQIYYDKYGNNVPIKFHPIIRSEEACFLSSSKAVALAKQTGSRLHILHISTARELELFTNDIPLENKKITAEVCVHHLWFNDSDYEKHGTRIKWNPAVKTKNDQIKLLEALKSNKIDVIATDHAPHTLEEKQNPYFKAPSGGPLVQHSLLAMLDLYHDNKISLETIVEKMCHSPARLFKVQERGYIREGYFADLVLLDLNQKYSVSKENILYKCGWSPFEGHTFKSSVDSTFVNGEIVYSKGNIFIQNPGMKLKFKM
jgi:dihydroorotase